NALKTCSTVALPGRTDLVVDTSSPSYRIPCEDFCATAGTESDGVCLPEFLAGLDVDGQDVANVTPGSIQRPAVRRDIRVLKVVLPEERIQQFWCGMVKRIFQLVLFILVRVGID